MVNPPRVFGFSLRWVCTRLASSELHLSPLLFLNLGEWCHQSSLSAFLPPSPAWHDMTSGRPSWTQVSNIRYHPCLRGLSSRLVTSWVITSVNTKTPKKSCFEAAENISWKYSPRFQTSKMNLFLTWAEKPLNWAFTPENGYSNETRTTARKTTLKQNELWLTVV